MRYFEPIEITINSIDIVLITFAVLFLKNAEKQRAFGHVAEQALNNYPKETVYSKRYLQESVVSCRRWRIGYAIAACILLTIAVAF